MPGSRIQATYFNSDNNDYFVLHFVQVLTWTGFFTDRVWSLSLIAERGTVKFSPSFQVVDSIVLTCLFLEVYRYA